MYLRTITPSCVKVKAVQLKPAESCWVFSGFPPSLILCSSPSGLGAGSFTGSGCWWHVGTCLDLCCLCEAGRDSHRQTERERERERDRDRDRERERNREETLGQLFPRVKWESPAAPVDRPWLMATLAGDKHGWRSATAASLLGECQNCV